MVHRTNYLGGGEPPAGTTSRFVDTAALRMHYLHAGEPGRPPVVLLHGFPQTSHMWRHQIPALAEHFEVVAPDTRGFGLTDKPRMRVDRGILARDIVDLIDALGFDTVHLVGHDWGGIIAAKVAFDHGDRLETLSLVDTLASVWRPEGVHGYWFKSDVRAEPWMRAHGREWIRSLFAGERGTYGGPPESPWGAPPESEGHKAMAGWDPKRHYTAEDADHFTLAFDDPDVWFHAIEYYRNALPFHFEEPDPDARHGVRYRFLSSNEVAAMWEHPGGLHQHPDAKTFPVFAPEDRHKRFDRPTMLLYSPFLLPQLFAGVDGLPADDTVPAGDLYADSFPRHFPNLQTRGARTGHFIPEEDPTRTTEVLLRFLRG